MGCKEVIKQFGLMEHREGKVYRYFLKKVRCIELLCHNINASDAF